MNLAEVADKIVFDAEGNADFLDMIKPFLKFCYRLLSYKGIFVDTGFVFCPVNKTVSPEISPR